MQRHKFEQLTGVKGLPFWFQNNTFLQNKVRQGSILVVRGTFNMNSVQNVVLFDGCIMLLLRTLECDNVIQSVYTTLSDGNRPVTLFAVVVTNPGQRSVLIFVTDCEFFVGVCPLCLSQLMVLGSSRLSLFPYSDNLESK